MYQVKCNGYILHDDNSEKLRLHNLDLELELNQLNSLNFTIYPTHPYYDQIQKLKPLIELTRDGELIFRGRILDYEVGFQNQVQVACEGELAFLLDSRVRPYEHTGTPAEFLEFLINTHNAQMGSNAEKKFVLGQVTVTDGDTTNDNNQIFRSNVNYPTVWGELNEKLIQPLGGYLLVDEDAEGNRRINYITENEFKRASQSVDFGNNLLDLKISSKGSEIITALIPLGGKPDSETGETEEETARLDITSYTTNEIIEEREDGIVYKIAETTDDVICKFNDYIFSQSGVAQYGFILGYQTFDDIKVDVQDLVRAGTEALNANKKSTESIELNALDMYRLKVNIHAFNIATKTKVTSLKHNMNEELPITKIKLNLLNPTTNKLTLQKVESTFTERTISNNKAQQADQGKIETIEANVSGLESKTNSNATAIAETTEKLTSMVNQTSDEIMTQVSEKHYLKDETDRLISNVETQVTQTKDEVEIRFNTFNQNIQNVIEGTDAQFQEISKYIRFKDGNILLGEEGNELVLKIQNDRISFLESDTEVAYFSNRKLFVLDGEFINTLRLGNFAFIPRANGNVSFKKVT